jgi:hypothetical protein
MDTGAIAAAAVLTELDRALSTRADAR